MRRVVRQVKDLRHSLLSVCAVAAACASAMGIAAAQPPTTKAAMAREYRAFLDEGRTPSRLIRYTLAHSTWRRIDAARDTVQPIRPGDRLVFVNEGRTAIYVIVGRKGLEKSGARLIATHIDTPSPKLTLSSVTRDSQLTLTADHHGGAKQHHWKGRPLAIVGEVVTVKGEHKHIELGLNGDAFGFFIEDKDGKYEVVASSTPTKAGTMGPAQTFVGLLFERYGINADDLHSAELYVVPRMPARMTGLDEAMVGAHGQDDRVNSYAAWRAITQISGTPEHTALLWFLDREEVGSTGRSGAQSRFLELVYGYLLRAEGSKTSESHLLRALAASVGLSSDTPACVNPNWPEVHELKHAPIIGRGPAVFPFTGHGGKNRGMAAHAELIRALHSTFDAAAVPLQTAELGRVDEGGGGTVAKYLAHRGIDLVDVGVCVIGMHSPFELTSVQDIWWAISGYRAWFTGR